MRRLLGKFCLVIIAIMFLQAAQATPLTFTLEQNSQWQNVIINLPSCQTVQSTQTCEFTLQNESDEAIGDVEPSVPIRVVCNGVFINNSPQYSCYIPNSDQLSQTTINVSVVAGTARLTGSCNIARGGSYVIRSECDGQILGAGQGCADIDDPSKNTFICQTA